MKNVKVGESASLLPEAMSGHSCSKPTTELDCCKEATRAVATVQDPEAAGLISLAHDQYWDPTRRIGAARRYSARSEAMGSVRAARRAGR